MDFLLFLTPVNKAIVNDLIKAKFHFIENAPICSVNERYFGFLHKDKRFIVCTRNILVTEEKPKFWINQTITHEAVHAAQNCKGKSLGYRTEDMPLSYKKVQFLMASTSVSKEFHKEHEAYYLEDSPQLVRSYIKKFCF